jgi:hypothetical protein
MGWAGVVVTVGVIGAAVAVGVDVVGTGSGRGKDTGF